MSTTATIPFLMQHTNDPNTRVFHTKFEMCYAPQTGIRGKEDELGEFGKMLLQTKGVVQIQMSAYMLLVTKAPLFEWEEVQEPIDKLLRMFESSQQELDRVPLPPGPFAGDQRSYPAQPGFSGEVGGSDSPVSA